MLIIIDGGWLTWAGREGDQWCDPQETVVRLEEMLAPLTGGFADWTKVKVAWDHPQSSAYRRSLCAMHNADLSYDKHVMYKRARAGKKKDGIKEHVEALKRMLFRRGARNVESLLEGDDTAYSLTVGRHKRKTLIVTADKDLLQAVRSKVSMLRVCRSDTTLISESNLPIIPIRYCGQTITGLGDAGWTTFQMACGDPGDDIPGVRGWGPKRALHIAKNEYSEIWSALRGEGPYSEHRRELSISLALVRLYHVQILNCDPIEYDF